MGLLDFFSSDHKVNDVNSQSFLFSKDEIQKIIKILGELSYIFRDSESLQYVGGDRNIKMMNCLHSYIGSFCVLYTDYNYGSVRELLDSTMLVRCALVFASCNDPVHKKESIEGLSENWSDVLNSIQAIKLGGKSDAERFISMEDEIEYVTKAMEKWSGKPCLRPKNVTYNPYIIIENASMSKGHSIPDLSSVFAEELLPQIVTARVMGKSDAEVTKQYVISMVDSYNANARYVPMCIVDSLCDQIGNIASRVGVEYPNNFTLKEYVLDEIYK